ncbi:hypothetical protein DYBT9623_04516 [Dyadobacter sp. CECT 9623]|uniref:Uncharacterized protein n=1 Tax=Dyadobacter linearis TaxID=2823330 RepID=A0ABM8UVY7_9BACT|nr:hypothetical protein [Dyadobacter sp. CECT 9623]CAG5072984.1 hypothetical protein DYBT9623_04516 [Dyadobacter sp. CECT 9623]
MKKNMTLIGLSKYAGLACIVLLSACNNDHEPDAEIPGTYKVVTGSGDINAKLAEFRTLLGDPLNTTPNQPAVGRREINWDGVPDNLTNTDTFPGDFFNSTDPGAPAGRKRGAVLSTPGQGLRVSNNDFTDVLTGDANHFNAFSPARTFAAVGSNKMDVTFKVPGTATDASVKGFGVIFSDVNLENYTTVEFYDGDKSLGQFKAPVKTDENGFSFLGVAFTDAKVTRVRITSGTAAIGKATYNAPNDQVIMDDFFYSEPLAQ